MIAVVLVQIPTLVLIDGDVYGHEFVIDAFRSAVGCCRATPGHHKTAKQAGGNVAQFVAMRMAPFPLTRVSLAGGPPGRIFDTDGYANFDCPRRPGAACVASKWTSHSLQFFSFDPISGKRTELFRLTSDLNPRAAWTISPDGDHLAILGAVNSGRIQIRSLTGKLDRTIEVKGWTDISGIDWAADGKSLFGAANGPADIHSGAIAATILHIALDGRVQPLRETRRGRQTWTIPSPDGKYLAIMEPGTERNAWMIENF